MFSLRNLLVFWSGDGMIESGWEWSGDGVCRGATRGIHFVFHNVTMCAGEPQVRYIGSQTGCKLWTRKDLY